MRRSEEIMNTIEVRHLRRVYRATIGVFRRKTKEVMAVDDISFDVKPGELFGLLGPNGAGKTITVKMLTTLLTTVSTSGLGLLMGCLSLITRNMMFVNNTVYFLLLVFCGANVPLTVLSGWMRAVSRFLPLTRGIASARHPGGDIKNV